MKILTILGIFCFSVSTAFAQAADVNAIDLSGKMDTIARGSEDLFTSLGGFLNVGLKNEDQWEDFEINAFSVNQDNSIIRFGGPLIFDTSNKSKINDHAILYGDFDGDGVGDIIGSALQVFFKGKKTYPYFDSTYKTTFHFFRSTMTFINTIDFNEDGVLDVLAESDSKSYFLLFKGGLDFGKNNATYADDSLALPAHSLGRTAITAATFGKHLRPMLVWSSGANSYILKQTGITLFEDSVILISDSASGGIRVTNLYATDITGDGITDLIVSDNYHIYIFKGGDDFGTYPLTPANAFYTIKSPRLTDFGNFGFVNDFGSSMYACGDLTGSGIPYLAVCGNQSGSGYNKGYLFFYAGGKALDTLYDAIVGYVGLGVGGIDTLHSINSTGRTACLINDFQDWNYHLRDLDFLMSRDCEKIPHETNPTMINVVNRTQADFEVHCYPTFANKFTKVQIISDSYSEATITVFNLLGQIIQQRLTRLDPGENTIFFNTTDWITGTYLVKVESLSHVAVVKVLIDH